MSRGWIGFLLGLLIGAPGVAGTLAERGLDPHITFTASDVVLDARGTSILRVRMALDPGWHTFPGERQVNGEGEGPAPLEVSLKGAARVSLAGAPAVAPLARVTDEGFQMALKMTRGSAWLTVPLRLEPGVGAGVFPHVLQVRTQVCNARNCLPPATFDIPFTVHVPAGGRSEGLVASAGRVPARLLQAQVPDPAPSSPQPPPRRAPAEPGLWAYLGLAALAGAASLLTPCVFPMVPITVSFFTQRAEGRRGKGLKDAALYGLGIVGTFTALGLGLALVFGATGIQTFAASPWLNLGLAGVFVLFALNLFGALELRMPTQLMDRLGARQGQEGVLNVLLMGLTFSLTSFTCTAPFVGSALVAAARGTWFRPVLGMLAYATVFALPFCLLALFPRWMSRLPRAGGWMNRLKVVLGFVELGAAVKFLSQADLAWGLGCLPRERFLALWVACALFIAAYLLGLFRFALDAVQPVLGAGRACAALGFGALGLYLGTGMQGGRLGELEAYLPPAANPPSSTESPTSPAEREWLSDYAQALEVARRTHRPVFLDFTGYTCTNCRWMEQNMFPRSEVAARLSRFVRVRLHTDRPVEPDLSHKRLQQERFQAIELPLYALLRPDGSLVATSSFTRDEAAFLAFLGKALPGS